jgi:glycosyltransferase involved in cell wall biosynthesis
MPGERQINSFVRCTVAIPVYNQKRFVSRAVASALRQQATGVDVLVVDNCSNDGTWEAMQPLAAEGVVIHRNRRNIGLFANFNRCLELARTPFLRFLSADDMLYTGCLERELAIMQDHADLAMLSTSGFFVSPEGMRLGRFATDFPPGIYDGREFPRVWLEYYARYRRNPLNYPSGVLFRRAAIGNLRFQSSWQTAGDIDFYFSVLKNGDLGIIDEPGCEVTRHPLQAHIRPNLDGTALREHLLLAERYLERAHYAKVSRQVAGGCAAVALWRSLYSVTRRSAAVHWRLALALAGPNAAIVAAGSLAIFRTLQALLGHRAPYVPRPKHALP